MVIFYVLIHYVLVKIRKTAKPTFKSVIGPVALLVKFHFGDIVGGKVALVTQFQNLINKNNYL